MRCLALIAIACATISTTGCASLKAQTKSALKAFEQGEAALAKQDYEMATKAFRKSLKIDSTFAKAHMRIAGIAFRKQDWETSKRHLHLVLQLAPERYQSVYGTLADIAWQESAYSDAAMYAAMFLQQSRISPNRRQSLEKIKRDAEYLQNQPKAQNIKITKLSPGINTAEPEYLPALPATEDLMVFTRRVRGQEDFFVSRKVDGTWLPAQPLNALNTPENEGAHCLSADGSLLIFTACARQDGLGSCDLYYAVHRDGQWSHPANLGKQVNSSAWDGQPSLSASGTTLFFSSSRPGGLGARDLWKVDRTAQGWSTPVNLKEINTPGNEEAPHLHYDGVSLFFMSDGHPGHGGTDLFKSVWNDSSWQSPENLGGPINTRENEGALYIDRLGTTGYFARAEEKTAQRQIDIYSFPIPDHLRPNPATYVQIQVVDASNQSPIQAIVEVSNLTTGKRFIRTLTSQQGEILVCLTQGSDYSLAVEKSDYAFYSANFSLSDVGTRLDPEVIKAPLTPLVMDESDPEPNTPIVLNNIFFKYGEAELLPQSEPELARLLKLLVEHPLLQIQIRGHTDNIGSDGDNLQLSEDRAQTIYDYLVAEGVAATRMSYLGMGENEPIATNDTEIGRQSNRRTDFVIQSN